MAAPEPDPSGAAHAAQPSSSAPADEDGRAAGTIRERVERGVVIAFTLAAVALAIHQLFNLALFGIVLIEGRYLYLLAGLFLSVLFLTFRARPGVKGPAPAYDWALAALAALTAGYFAWTAESALDMGWEYAAPEDAVWASLLLYLLVLEGTRRTGGTVLFAIVLFFSLYPTFADQVPAPLTGFAQPFWDTVPYHMISAESSFGIPMKAFGSLVIGFILFGAVLARTGGGAFF
ncbi:MAG: TRAP transporter permease, partial [Pseudomonadota bacterium]